MLFTAAFSALSLVAAVSAQMNVQVGFTSSDPGGIFQFKPNNFNAPNGTVITFQFIGAPGNHTVTQSTFADPCNPVSGGFDSGWVFIPMGGVSQTPEWNLTITDDSKPIWFFCKQLAPTPHCAAGMVGAINAPATGNNFQTFAKNALSTGQKGSGQGEGGLVGIGASASAGIGPIPSGAILYPSAAASGSGAGAASGGASPTGTSPASSPSTSPKSGASKVVVNSLVGLSAAALGVILL